MEIQKVTLYNMDKVVKYIIECREELYPMLSENKLPNDLLDFEGTYLKNIDSFFLIAVDGEKNIVGTIGLIPYDNRFKMLNYTQFKVAEIVKLYVDSSNRRQKVGHQLVNCLVNEALLLNYKILYLHTHPFLTGAVEFWEKNSFKIERKDIEQDLPTIHMKRLIS